jgi:hypothetical protein
MVCGMNHLHLQMEFWVHATCRWLARNIKTPPNTLIHNLPLVEHGVGHSLLPPWPGFPHAQIVYPAINFIFYRLGFWVGLMDFPLSISARVYIPYLLLQKYSGFAVYYQQILPGLSSFHRTHSTLLLRAIADLTKLNCGLILAGWTAIRPFKNGGRSDFWGGCRTCTSQRRTMEFCILIDIQMMNNL